MYFLKQIIKTKRTFVIVNVNKHVFGDEVQQAPDERLAGGLHERLERGAGSGELRRVHDQGVAQRRVALLLHLQ